MNHPRDNKHLLDDVLSEAAPPDFRETLLGETLRLVRRRRHWRQMRHTMTLFVALGLVVVLVRQNLPKHPAVRSPVAKVTEKSYTLVQTQALPVGAIVTTRPLGAEQFIASARTASVVETVISNGFHVINDEELLVLLSPRPAALIRLGPDSERLILVNPEDEKGFPLN